MSPRRAKTDPNAPKKRRPKGTGGVTKHKGRHLARVQVWENGVLVKRSKLHDTAAEANAWIVGEQERVKRGEALRPIGDRQTLGDFLTEFYTVTRTKTRGRDPKRRQLAATTCEADLALCRYFIGERAPELWATPLGKVTETQLEQFFRDLPKSVTLANGKTTKPLGVNTVDRIFRLLRARLEFAVAKKKLLRNPMLSDQISVTGTAPRERKTLTFPQLEAVLEQCRTARYGNYFALLAYTGARVSEICSLTWADVDLDARRLTIATSLARYKPAEDKRQLGESWERKTTKTGKARTVPLHPDAIAFLEAQRVEQDAWREAAGDEWGNDVDLVFTTPFGTPLFIDALATRYFHPVLRAAALKLAGVEPLPVPLPNRSAAYKTAVAARRAQEDAVMRQLKFPRVALQELRHTQATLLRYLGVDFKTIQEQLGHSRLSTTTDIYMQEIDEQREAAADAFANALRKR